MAQGGVLTSATMLVLSAWAVPAAGQSVISARSGIVHYFEGAVTLAGRPLESHLGKFPGVPPGAELRTELGRAEVILTPGVFLRMGERTAIRMLSNDLADTQVEFLSGSVIVDAGEANQDTAVTLLFKNWKVHFPQKGVYRIDSAPPRLWTLQGEAQVSDASRGDPITVAERMDLPFAAVLVPEASSHQPTDALNDWNKGRSQSIIADNAITAQIDEDPANSLGGSDSFTYFPFLGVPSLSLVSPSAYNLMNPYQAGFNSIYLPGYTSQPLLLGILGRGYRMSAPSSPSRVPRGGVLPGYGSTATFPTVSLPRAPILRPTIPIHVGSTPAPVAAPMPVHTAPHPVHNAPSVGVHGGHR